MDNMITLTIDGVQVSVPAGTTVLEAALVEEFGLPKGEAVTLKLIHI